MKSFADLEPIALQQPGAVRRDGSIKFQCPDCRAEGHDAHRDNAGYFLSSRQWGCAVGLKAHWRSIGEALGAFTHRNGAGPSRPAQGVREGDGPVVVTLADVAPEPVSWTWRNRAAKGKLGLIIGDPGKGKTSFALELCARRSKGAAWPDGTPADEPEDSLYFTAEDGLADTLRVHIDRQGGDPRRIHVLTAVREQGQDRMPTLEHDLAAIEQAIIMCSAKLVIIDPLSAYLGSRDSYKDAEIRSLLGPLATLAQRHGVAVLGILHLNKTAQRQILHRAGASIAFVAAGRTVLVVSEDAEMPPRRLLISAKNNLGPLAPTLAFRISDVGLRWDEGEVAGAVERLLAGDEMPTRSEARALDTAAQFLRDLLRDGPVPSTQVEKDAKANGISQRTLWRAKDDLEITSSRMPGQRGSWFWALPEPVA